MPSRVSKNIRQVLIGVLNSCEIVEVKLSRFSFLFFVSVTLLRRIIDLTLCVSFSKKIAVAGCSWYSICSTLIRM